MIVNYDPGATLSYSLNAHSPWEGYRIYVNGTEGRVELEVVERAPCSRRRTARRLVVDPSAVAGIGEPVRRRAADLCSATGRRPRTSRSSKAKGVTAAVTRCCWPMFRRRR